MKKVVIAIVVIVGLAAVIIHFTGNTDKVKKMFSGAAAKSKGYKKEIDPEHLSVKTDYETSQQAVDKYAVLVRDSLKQGEEATEAKQKLSNALKTFKTSNTKMNELGYLNQDQYEFNKKRIVDLVAITK